MLRLTKRSLKVFTLFALIACVALLLQGFAYKRLTVMRQHLQNITTFHDFRRSALLQPSNSSPYHRYYSVNCSAVFAGDKCLLHDIYWNNVNDPVRVPSDDEIADNWFRDCSKYKEDRNYPTKALSKEEEEFPIAYAIVTYKNAAQVERLFRSIYQPQNVYCIHTDLKSNANFSRAIENLAKCFDNVFIASKLEKVQWAGISVTLADLHCMEDLLRHPIPWKYFINLCGQDFPLKTNFEIVQQLKAYNGHNCISGYPVEKGSRYEIRYQYKYFSPSLNSPPALVMSSDGRRQEKDPPRLI
ncbi:beta-1,3-galactosyl-O-glycosyl-glycoprotein beta-1,6-N-acetylglucosaminyltransferase 4-like [Amphiura filiformis]|uniref:beta-1,3-galactosyl-O-glycosyl-glycoprotein beta-1,6-N-acetylglucosaminyltransferase 4-like n=1 Tax=Amphiura filiformis TaxID=82378 RepID=UPI003B21B9E8